VGNVTGNRIGSLDGSSTVVVTSTSVAAGTIPIFGILNFADQSSNISNNQMGAITIQGTGTTVGFRGILVFPLVAATNDITGNVIGGPTVAGAITDTQVGSYAMYAIDHIERHYQ
jgi:hypothetical protein